MIFVFPFGVPYVYFHAIRKKRRQLTAVDDIQAMLREMTPQDRGALAESFKFSGRTSLRPPTLLHQ